MHRSIALLVLLLCAEVARADNPPQPLPPKRPGVVRIVCVGDSITFAASTTVPWTETYPAQLERRLGKGYEVLNYGRNGRTVQDKHEWPYVRDEAFAITTHSDAEYVVIMIGTNDSKPRNWDAAEYERQLEAFVETYRAMRTRPRIILMTPPVAYPNPATIDPVVIEREIIPIVLRVANRQHVVFLNMHAHTEGHAAEWPDGIHPNVAGCASMADRVFRTIRRLEADRKAGPRPRSVRRRQETMRHGTAP